MIETINNIEFDIAPHIPIDKLSKKFEFLKFVKEGVIDYIEILEKDEGYVYINKKESKDEWEDITINICDLFNRVGIESSLSDQDYGYVDVIVIHGEMW